MSPWDGLNRRKFPRVLYPCLIILRRGKDTEDSVLTHTENIGVGGISAIVKKNIKLFAPVDLEIDLMDMEEHVFCEGKVVWSVRRKDSVKRKASYYDIGIEFNNIEEKDRERIVKVVEVLAKQGKTAPYK